MGRDDREPKVQQSSQVQRIAKTVLATAGAQSRFRSHVADEDHVELRHDFRKFQGLWMVQDDGLRVGEPLDQPDASAGRLVLWKSEVKPRLLDFPAAFEASAATPLPMWPPAKGIVVYCPSVKIADDRRLDLAGLRGVKAIASFQVRTRKPEAGGCRLLLLVSPTAAVMALLC